MFEAVGCLRSVLAVKIRRQRTDTWNTEVPISRRCHQAVQPCCLVIARGVPSKFGTIKEDTAGLSQVDLRYGDDYGEPRAGMPAGNRILCHLEVSFIIS